MKTTVATRPYGIYNGFVLSYWDYFPTGDRRKLPADVETRLMYYYSELYNIDVILSIRCCFLSKHMLFSLYFMAVILTLRNNYAAGGF